MVAGGVAALLLALGVLMAAVPSAWWAFVVGLIMAVSVLIVFGRKEAVARGIRSREDTPKGLLMAISASGAVIGVLSAHTGRYSGLGVAVCVLVLLVGERVAWRRFDASRRGSRSSLGG